MNDACIDAKKATSAKRCAEIARISDARLASTSATENAKFAAEIADFCAVTKEIACASSMDIALTAMQRFVNFTERSDCGTRRNSFAQSASRRGLK